MSLNNYWDHFYSTFESPRGESAFARWVLEELRRERVRGVLIDAGCGNARDTSFFAANRVDAIGVDAAGAAFPAKLAGRLFVDDMGKLDAATGHVVSCVYSRFSLHAISPAVADAFLRRAYEILAPGGVLFIEARSTNDALALRGVAHESDANARLYDDGHYRRFINLNELVMDLSWKGFAVELAGEQAGWARAEHEDPIVVRIKARK